MKFYSTKIFLVLSFAILHFCGKAQTQIHGRILDNKSSGIPYSSIVIQGKTTGIVADEQGAFTLILPEGIKDTDTLVVSSIAFSPKSISIKDAVTTEIIYLEEKPQEL